MVDEAEFFRIADEIAAEGRTPSQREIRAALSGGGSFRDLGPLFVRWSVAKDFRPRPTKDRLPQRLLDKLTSVAAEIWADGLREGKTEGQNERDELIKKNEAVTLAYTEAATRADTLEERLPVRDMKGHAVVGKGAPPPGHGKGPRFWAGVMSEIVDLLDDRQLSVEEILGGLSQETVRRAPELRESRRVSLLAYRMRYYADLDRYFFEVEENVFRRRGKDDPPSRPAGNVGAPPPPASGGHRGRRRIPGQRRVRHDVEAPRSE